MQQKMQTNGTRNRDWFEQPTLGIQRLGQNLKIWKVQKTQLPHKNEQSACRGKPATDLFNTKKLNCQINNLEH